jgi:hypothetical protein
MSWKLGIVHILTLVAIFMGEDVACPINCHGAVNVVHERCTIPSKKFTNFSFSIPLYLSTYSFISSSFLPYFSIDKIFDNRGESLYCWNAPRCCKGCRNYSSISSSQKYWENSFGIKDKPLWILQIEVASM